MLHQINKLQFEAACATEAQAFEVRQNFAQIYQRQVTEVIDKVCSLYVSEDEWIHIDRVEVDLGNFDLQSFEKNFTRALLAKFENAISKQVGMIPDSIKHSSKQLSYLEMLLYFLQTGAMPWWVDNETARMNRIFLDEVAVHQPQPLYHFLQQHRFTATIWQRIAMQFNHEVHRFLVYFFPHLMVAEKKIMQWAGLLASHIHNNTYALNFNRPELSEVHKFIITHAPVFFSAVEFHENQQLIHQFANEFTRSGNGRISPKGAADILITFENTPEARVDITFPGIDEIKKSEEDDPAIIADALLPHKFTVHTAGLVLLAPYFKQMFTHVDLLVQGEWKNQAAQYKAIHLTRYLATGQQMCPEYSLVLEKLLCGMELNAPIPVEIVLSENEIAESAALLKSVISNWPRLKNTSVEGLRETFLKRDGIVTKKENGWLLQVETKTPDVLLESIPWSFATLAFSWSSYIIFTEW